MKSNLSDLFTRGSAALFAILACSLLCTGMMTACSQATYPNRGPIVVDSAEVTGTVFWPSSEPHYLLALDTVVVELSGLMRGYTCGQVLACSLETDTSNSDSTVLHPYAKIEYPGTPTCPLDLQGLDTSLRYVVTPTPGAILYLNNSSNLRNDSALVVSGKVWAETLLSVPTDTDTLLAGSFTFYDSTATHAYRALYASLPACEVLQGAVFTQSGDSVKVRFHVLELDSTASQRTLHPCAGPQTDSVLVVPDIFTLPSN